MKNTGIRIFLFLIIFLLFWYTFNLYRDLYSNLAIKKTSVQETELKEQQEWKRVEDPDELIDEDILKKAESQWDSSRSGLHMQSRVACSTKPCPDGQMDFKVISGAANVIGPSICFNRSILMKNSLNNVDRGLNVARVNGISGSLEKASVFDLYSKDSTDLKAFLREVEDHHIVLISSYDDAASRLDDEARTMLVGLGSKKAKTLSFRDNWIFVGGKSLEEPHEAHMANNKETNKYGDWPGAITIEGCVPPFSKS